MLFRSNPGLHIFLVNALYRGLHQGLPFNYDVDGRVGGLYEKDLFWDGFHPWTEPGAQVLANLALARVNTVLKDAGRIPYIDIADKYLPPYTGVVLIAPSAPVVSTPIRVVNAQGEAAPMSVTGEWGRERQFDRRSKALAAQIGRAHV